uniref:Uncharacterized protein n=1 Tax=Lymantria dispar multicapsid nuclear polyhedrosis virus TaxID=10449 RepID=A0A1B1MQY1_NPVLD|nr:hypothetical protein [Lymantria dispar multiple nucleopolyhedrovirus]
MVSNKLLFFSDKYVSDSEYVSDSNDDVDTVIYDLDEQCVKRMPLVKAARIYDLDEQFVRRIADQVDKTKGPADVAAAADVKPEAADVKPEAADVKPTRKRPAVDAIDGKVTDCSNPKKKCDDDSKLLLRQQLKQALEELIKLKSCLLEQQNADQQNADEDADDYNNDDDSDGSIMSSSAVSAAEEIIRRHELDRQQKKQDAIADAARWADYADAFRDVCNPDHPDNEISAVEEIIRRQELDLQPKKQDHADAFRDVCNPDHPDNEISAVEEIIRRQELDLQPKKQDHADAFRDVCNPDHPDNEISAVEEIIQQQEQQKEQELHCQQKQGNNDDDDDSDDDIPLAQYKQRQQVQQEAAAVAAAVAESDSAESIDFSIFCFDKLLSDDADEDNSSVRPDIFKIMSQAGDQKLKYMALGDDAPKKPKDRSALGSTNSYIFNHKVSDTFNIIKELYDVKKPTTLPVNVDDEKNLYCILEDITTPIEDISEIVKNIMRDRMVKLYDAPTTCNADLKFIVMQKLFNIYKISKEIIELQRVMGSSCQMFEPKQDWYFVKPKF